jgi:hypothetical protein
MLKKKNRYPRTLNKPGTFVVYPGTPEKAKQQWRLEELTKFPRCRKFSHFLLQSRQVKRTFPAPTKRRRRLLIATRYVPAPRQTGAG